MSNDRGHPGTMRLLPFATAADNATSIRSPVPNRVHAYPPVRIAERPRCDAERLPHPVRAAVITA